MKAAALVVALLSVGCAQHETPIEHFQPRQYINFTTGPEELFPLIPLTKSELERQAADEAEALKTLRALGFQ